jgi:hypothetical protein
LPAFLLPRGAKGSNPPSGFTTELSYPKQLLDLGLYHQGLARMREEKVVDGTAQLLSFRAHPLDHLL